MIFKKVRIALRKVTSPLRCSLVVIFQSSELTWCVSLKISIVDQQREISEVLKGEYYLMMLAYYILMSMNSN